MNNSKEAFEEVIEKLRNGDLEKYEVNKESFFQFRDVLMKQEDKENIRGEAKKGGAVIYTYVNE